MSRRRRLETVAHRKERNRKRIAAAEKRRAWSDWRWARAVALYRGYLKRKKRGEKIKAIWWHVPRSWARRIRKGKAKP